MIHQKSTVIPKRRNFSLTKKGRSDQAIHDVDAAAVAVRGLSAGYAGQPAIVNISFELGRGERLAVVGPNGAGKSTLLKALAGLLDPMKGKVLIHGHGPCRHICIAYVPQKNTLDWRFPITLADFVMLGRTQRIGPLRKPRSQDHDVVRSSLEAVELTAYAQRQIEALSGGQQQRLFIARALAQKAELILFDEPLVGLDVHTHREVLALIANLYRRAVTVIMSLHDLSIAASHFDKILLLRGETMGFGTPKAVLTEDVLRRAYGSCLQVIPDKDGAFIIHDTACSGGEHEDV
ncbi:metal ABC transporter ATP-binding protein [Candidatus Bipolaricaulota bacterium]|nr:metal ABC transporter ATP-binding protein [Candidatus Bipolaricaulota bacterium]